MVVVTAYFLFQKVDEMLVLLKTKVYSQSNIFIESFEEIINQKRLSILLKKEIFCTNLKESTVN